MNILFECYAIDIQMENHLHCIVPNDEISLKGRYRAAGLGQLKSRETHFQILIFICVQIFTKATL